MTDLFVDSTDELEALEFELLLTGVAQRYGYDFRSYTRTSLVRRIRVAMENEGVTSASALQERILRDPSCMARFVATVSVHTTAMFRDPAFYLALRDQVFPLLRSYPFVRIWHAGCATGEEVYSLAIFLQEADLYDRCRIYATDISDGLLERARRGIFPLSSMREYTTAYQRAGGARAFSSYYLADAENAIFNQSLRRNVVFSQHNLACDGVFNEFHLILCRNVAIYFEKQLRDRALDLFHQSLCTSGVLGLGQSETLRFTPRESCYEELNGGARIYRKIRD
jgi:chemotaxis protein methyltransferase CheR